MIANIPFLREQFAICNGRYFGGRLVLPMLKLGHSRQSVAKCTYAEQRMPDGSKRLHNFSIIFSVEFDLTEDEMIDTLIHEMIHYYIGWYQLSDTLTHGALFCQMMNDINTKYGRHVTIKVEANNPNVVALPDKRRLLRVVAVAKFHSGELLVRVLPRIVQRLVYYREHMLRDPNIESMRFYLTDSPYFSRYPKSTALALYKIPYDDLILNLQGAREVVVQADGRVYIGTDTFSSSTFST